MPPNFRLSENPSPPGLSPCSFSFGTPVHTRSQRPPAIRSPHDRVSRCHGDHSTRTVRDSPTGERTPKSTGAGQWPNPRSQGQSLKPPGGRAPSCREGNHASPCRRASGSAWEEEDAPRQREGSGPRRTQRWPLSPRPTEWGGVTSRALPGQVLAAHHASRTQREIPPHVNVNCKHLLLKRTPFFKSPQRSGYASG